MGRWRYSGEHLAKTGRVIGADRKVFEQVECSCAECQSGRWIAVDERHEWYEGYRHIAREALVEAGKPSTKDGWYLDRHLDKYVQKLREEHSYGRRR